MLPPFLPVFMDGWMGGFIDNAANGSIGVVREVSDFSILSMIQSVTQSINQLTKSMKPVKSA